MAIALATTAAITANPHNLPASLITAAISSLVPDIDEEHSLIRQKIDIPGFPIGFILLLTADYFLWTYKYFSLPAAILFAVYVLLAYFTKHRSFTHSLSGFTTFALMVSLSSRMLLIPATIGYGTHLLADMLTNTGIELLYPVRKKFGISLINTGSLSDTLMGAASGILFIAILYQKLI